MECEGRADGVFRPFKRGKDGIALASMLEDFPVVFVGDSDGKVNMLLKPSQEVRAMSLFQPCTADNVGHE